MVFILCYGLVKKVDIVNVFCEGATENLKIAVGLIPMLILLMTAVGMFTSSGAADIIAKLLRPVTTFLGFPEECIPLAIVRPISGSGALACLETILSSVSPDSYSGRVASVLMGSTETTFYTIAVYFSAIKQKAYPSVFAAACLSDLMGFVFSALAVRLFFSYNSGINFTYRYIIDLSQINGGLTSERYVLFPVSADSTQHRL